MRKLIKIGGIFIVTGLIILFIAWAKSGFGLTIDSFKKIDPVNLQAAQTKKLSEFKSISINTSTYVTVKTSDTFKIVSRTPKGVSIHSKVDGDQLSVTQSGQGNKTKRFGAIVINGDWNDLNGKVTIYVPSSWKLNHITQESKNNDLTLNHLTIDDELILHGNSEISHVTAKSLNAHTGDDDISIDNSKFENDNSDITTNDGDAKISNSKFKSLTKVKADDGDVNITKTEVLDGLTSINSSDGDVTVKRSQFDTLKLASDNGDVDFKNLDIKNNLDVTNNSGDINGKLISGDHANIKTSNSSGDVNVKKSLDDINAKKQYRFRNNNGDINVD